VLGHAGKGPGRFDDVTDKKNPGGDLLAGIDRAAGHDLAVADARGPRDGNGGPSIGAGHDMQATGPTDVLQTLHPARGHEDDPRPHVDLPRPVGSAGDRSADAVYAKIRQSYFGRVQKCYEDVLKRDSTLGGRVDVTLTIGDRGQVMAVDADGFDPTLDACIEADARRWRFEPSESSSTFEFPFSFSRSF
jgi:hypothetical protein